jgi:hypothetical protein
VFLIPRRIVDQVLVGGPSEAGGSMTISHVLQLPERVSQLLWL